MGMLVDTVSTQFHVSHIHLPRSIIRPCEPLFECMHPHIIQLASYKGRFAFIIVSKYFRIILFEMGKIKAVGMFTFLLLLQQAEILLAIPTYQTGEFLCVNQHEASEGVVHTLSCSSLFPGQSVWWCISQSSMEYLLLQSATGSLLH